MSKMDRRQFLILPVFGVLSTSLLKSVQAQPQPQPATQLLSETNPQAIGLGYKMNTASIDRRRWTQFVPGQSCGNCIQFQGARGNAQGSCRIFGDQAVMAAGWCSLYKAV